MACAYPYLGDSEEKTNFVKISRLLIDGGTASLRHVFDSIHPPAILAAYLNANQTMIEAELYPAKGKRFLFKKQWESLYPPSGCPPPSSQQFDISLLFHLLRCFNICGLNPPSTGWDVLPVASDNSKEGHLARIKYYRNEVYGHINTTEINNLTFESYWNELSNAILSLGVVKQSEIDELKTSPLGTKDYLDLTAQWWKSDVDVAKELSEVSSEMARQSTQQTEIKTVLVSQSTRLEQQASLLELQTSQLARLSSQQTEIKTALENRTTAPGINIHIDCKDATTTPGCADPPNKPDHHKAIIHDIVKAYLEQIGSSQKGKIALLKYLLDFDLEHVCSEETNSLCITVSCPTKESLLRLWADYTSGHLNQMVEWYLVTDKTLKKFGVQDVKLETRISDAECWECLTYFVIKEMGEIEIDAPAPLKQSPAPLQSDDVFQLEYSRLYPPPMMRKITKADAAIIRRLKLGSDWMEVGKKLRLDKGWIQYIAKISDTDEDKACSMWEELVVGHECIRKTDIITALRDSGKPDVADKIRDYFCADFTSADADMIGNLGTTWKDFGRYLGVLDKDIEEIDRINTSDETKSLALINGLVRLEPYLCEIIDGLFHCGKEDVAVNCLKSNGINIERPPSLSITHKDTVSALPRWVYVLSPLSMPSRRLHAFYEKRITKADVALISRYMGSHWMDAGRELGLDEERLQIIDERFDRDEEKAREMLYEYMDTKDRYHPSQLYHRIMKVLRSIGNLGVADEMEEYWHRLFAPPDADVISMDLGSSWKDLGNELGIRKKVVEEIDKERTSDEVKSHALTNLLTQYKYHLSDVVDAMFEIGKQDVAEKFLSTEYISHFHTYPISRLGRGKPSRVAPSTSFEGKYPSSKKLAESSVEPSSRLEHDTK